MVHALKIYPEYYEAVKSGKKPFEVRKNDRDFKVGDILALNEFDPLEGKRGNTRGGLYFKEYRTFWQTKRIAKRDLSS